MTGDIDTICAIATPPGKGGVSIIRLSGPASNSIVKKIIHSSPSPRFAHYGSFYNSKNDIIDSGITLYFPGPHSFTGEDIIEFHAHGGPFVVDILLNEILKNGIRLARPGEFSERAFLNNKIDLTQAEAIADLIDSQSSHAAKMAQRSLQGEFSSLINNLVSAITTLRVYVESSIDFPEEEIDFLNSGDVKGKLHLIQNELTDILNQAKQGSIIKEGLTVVIAGEPNTGKSSLLNLLSGQSTAIVTDIAGTTRDILKEQITLDGLPIHIIDTAGLRLSEDIVEQEGIKRAWKEIKKADQILFLIDATNQTSLKDNPVWQQIRSELPNYKSLTLINNKIDLTNTQPSITQTINDGLTKINLSVKQQQGIELLKHHLFECAGYNSSEEGGFIARRRHLDSLHSAESSLSTAMKQLNSHNSGELVAEDLRIAQNHLSEITGEFSSDDLLGEIFSNFCIGK